MSRTSIFRFGSSWDLNLAGLNLVESNQWRKTLYLPLSSLALGIIMIGQGAVEWGRPIGHDWNFPLLNQLMYRQKQNKAADDAQGGDKRFKLLTDVMFHIEAVHFRDASRRDVIDDLQSPLLNLLSLQGHLNQRHGLWKCGKTCVSIRTVI